jgi:hypothetical protein
MARQGSSSTRKCPSYRDLDASDCEVLVDTPLEFSMALHTKSRPSSTLEGKREKMSIYEKNLDYLPKAYGHFVREVALEYYKRFALDSLKRNFLN